MSIAFRIRIYNWIQNPSDETSRLLVAKQIYLANLTIPPQMKSTWVYVVVCNMGIKEQKVKIQCTKVNYIIQIRENVSHPGTPSERKANWYNVLINKS